MECVDFGAKTFQEPFGRQTQKVRDRLDAELDERRLRVGWNVEPRQRYPLRRAVFVSSALENMEPAQGPRNSVGSET